MATKYVHMSVDISMSQAANESSTCKIELDSHADRSVVDDNCLIVHDHARSVDVYGYAVRDKHKHAMTIDAAIGNRSSHWIKIYIYVESSNAH